MKLGDKIKLIGGGTPSKDIPEYWDGSIPWVSVKDFKSEIIKTTVDHITEKGLQNSVTKLVKKGTLLISTRMAVGKTAIAGVDLTFNQDIKAIEVSKDINTKFLHYFLKSKQNYFDTVSSGATVKGIKIQDITNLEVNIPPLSEQQRIADLLDAADALRQKDKALLEKYEALGQSLFLELFGDPVSNPKGWEVLTLGGICDVRDGTHDSPKYVVAGYPLITSKNIKNSKLDFTDINYISKLDFDKINNRSKVDKGDILMPMIGTIGNPVLIEQEVDFAIKNVALIKPISNQKVIQKIILFLLSGHYLKQYSENFNKGGTQKFLSLGDIRKMPVFIPDIDLQNHFASQIELIEQQKAKLKENLEKSEALFQGLLGEVFN